MEDCTFSKYSLVCSLHSTCQCDVAWGTLPQGCWFDSDLDQTYCETWHEIKQCLLWWINNNMLASWDLSQCQCPWKPRVRTGVGTCGAGDPVSAGGQRVLLVLLQGDLVLAGLRVLQVGLSPATGRHQQGDELPLLHLGTRQHFRG